MLLLSTGQVGDRSKNLLSLREDIGFLIRKKNAQLFILVCKIYCINENYLGKGVK